MRGMPCGLWKCTVLALCADRSALSVAEEGYDFRKGNRFEMADLFRLRIKLGKDELRLDFQNSKMSV